MNTENAFDVTTKEGLEAMLAQADAIRRKDDLVAFMKFCERLTAETDIYECEVYTIRRREHGKRVSTWAARIHSEIFQCDERSCADDPLNALFNALYHHVYSSIVRIKNLTK